MVVPETRPTHIGLKRPLDGWYFSRTPRFGLRIVVHEEVFVNDDAFAFGRGFEEQDAVASLLVCYRKL
jgi:hypothetical protein